MPLRYQKTVGQRTVCITLFCMLFLTYGYARQRSGPNQNSRMSMLHALVLEHRASIDTYEKSTVDKAEFNGHYYSDKAPGTVFLAIPGYVVGWLLLLLAAAAGAPMSGIWTASAWFATLGSVSLISAAAGTAFYLLLCDVLRRRDALLSTIAIFFGTGMFTYATTFFSHAGTAGALFFSLWLMLKKKSAHGYAAAGACAGIAFTCEYPAAVAVVALAIIAMRDGRRAFFFFAAGAAVPVLLLLSFNLLTYGTPFFLGYAHTVWPKPAGMPDSIVGFNGPSLRTVLFLLFSPMRGLFFWSPFLLLSIAGIRPLFRHNKFLCTVLLGMFSVYILVIASHLEPGGGSALGPRHLTPLVPFIGLFAAFGFSRFRIAGMLLGVSSLMLTGIGTFVTSMAPQNMKAPLLDFYVPSLLSGYIAPNLGVTVGLPPWISIVLPVILLAIASTWLWLHLPRD